MAVQDLSNWGIFQRAVKCFEATLTFADLADTDAVTGDFDLGDLSGLGDIPDGAVILGCYTTLNTAFAVVGDTSYVLESLTVGDVEITPDDDWDIMAGSATAGAVAAGAIMRPADGAITLTLTSDVNLSGTTAGSVTVGIVYFTPNE